MRRSVGALKTTMRPRDELRNGVDGGERSRPASASGSEEGSGGEGDGSGGADELSLWDEGAPARVLAALNALRKSRQHFDVLLVADGAEVAAHRAVLAAASPYLLEALQTPATAHRVEHVEAEALRALVEYAYTGRLRVRDAAGARRLYRAAWRLRIEPVRAHLAAALMRTAAPHDCLQLRALPDLPPDHLKRLDEYIASNFEEICSSGAMGGLPVINIEMLRESSAEDGEEAPVAVAEAALAWLRERQPPDVDVSIRSSLAEHRRPGGAVFPHAPAVRGRARGAAGLRAAARLRGAARVRGGGGGGGGGAGRGGRGAAGPARSPAAAGRARRPRRQASPIDLHDDARIHLVGGLPSERHPVRGRHSRTLQPQRPSVLLDIVHIQISVKDAKAVLKLELKTFGDLDLGRDGSELSSIDILPARY
ncbi:unnamed protein product [Diatraea saccharalis]|uniref:BTB domain-containing protein n=1 Tax=Diatraea saccharalis TaxID=40085 RepID=A0A9N9WH41_9NEOP|nr:unnamed protein product [Diatraea saccharalis]